MKPYSEACERNQQPILDVLTHEFAASSRVLEIGSGTGQHAVFFGRHLPHLSWQTSDLPEHHAGIRAWIRDAGLANVSLPITLNVTEPWPAISFDSAFSANTAHIMSWPAVVDMFTQLGARLPPGGRFALYGPFNENGRYTSESNASFDQWLKARDAGSGIRDAGDLKALAQMQGLEFRADHSMPANNRILVWEKA
jgi:cyclopropane fatty-acyl-phospholipid synthase-like methyltransferase